MSDAAFTQTQLHAEVDFLPIIGDAKGFAECGMELSVGSCLGAVAGLIPLLGDGAKILLKRGDDVIEVVADGAGGARVLDDGVGGVLDAPRSIEFDPKGSVILQGDAPVCGPASCAMVIRDRNGSIVDLDSVVKQFDEMSDVLTRNGLNSKATTKMTPTTLQDSLQNGNSVIVQVPSGSGRHFIVVDSFQIVDGVPYYMTRDPYTGPRGVRADILDQNMTGEGIFLD